MRLPENPRQSPGTVNEENAAQVKSSSLKSNFNNKPTLTIHKHTGGMSAAALRQADLGAKYSAKAR